MNNMNTTVQEDKLEWRTPDLEIILSEKTEHGASPTGNDGLGIWTES